MKKETADGRTGVTSTGHLHRIICDVSEVVSPWSADEYVFVSVRLLINDNHAADPVRSRTMMQVIRSKRCASFQQDDKMLLRLMSPPKSADQVRLACQHGSNRVSHVTMNQLMSTSYPVYIDIIRGASHRASPCTSALPSEMRANANPVNNLPCGQPIPSQTSFSVDHGASLTYDHEGEQSSDVSSMKSRSPPESEAVSQFEEESQLNFSNISVTSFISNKNDRWNSS